MPPSIPYVAEFIRDFQKKARKQPPTSEHVWWISRDNATVFFTERTERAYRATIDHLEQDFASAEDLSRRSIETLLDAALFGALDIHERSTASFEDRLAKAVRQLSASLTAPTINYLVYLTVEGFAARDLPFTFGGIRFARFGKAQARQIPRILRTFRLYDTPIWNAPCAAVPVQARDTESAESRARQALSHALDCLNFIGRRYFPGSGWLRLPGEASSVHVVVPVVGEIEGRSSVRLDRLEPSTTFALSQLRGQARTAHLVSAIGALYRAYGARRRTGDKRSAGEALLASIEWAGRASTEQRREHAFLLYAISLETLVLPRKDDGLKFRLGLRVARLLGASRDERLRIRDAVLTLYDIRSKIAHSGSYEVSRDSLLSLQGITRGVIIRILRRRGLWRQRVDALDRFFRDREIA